MSALHSFPVGSRIRLVRTRNPFSPYGCTTVRKRKGREEWLYLDVHTFEAILKLDANGVCRYAEGCEAKKQEQRQFQ